MADNLAFLSLGSNIDPEHNLPAAISLLADAGRVRAVSGAWQSAALGRVDQPDFVNAAVLLATDQDAAALKSGPLAEIEATLGRVRTEDKNAPRTIDIDIVLFNDAVFDLGDRHIPSAEIYERAFVALPLAEIAPDYVHPETGETLRSIADHLIAATRLRPRPDIPLGGII